MKKYQPKQLEEKWQKRWVESNLYASNLTAPKKYYVLAEFAYPSGDLHTGHWFTWAGADVFARFKRMQGYSVFFPNGFDAFGLPAENAAIKRKIHPQDWTLSNIAQMKEQYATLGGSFTFDHEVITCTSEYYKWNQWIFLKMYERGLVYRGTYLSNWCNVCQTVLANEGVVEGACWRCGTPVEEKEVLQWFFKIINYVDRLIWPNNPGVDWPKSIRDAQNFWIGKSKGVVIKFPLADIEKEEIDIFTTRVDTIFGATFLVLAPEHPKTRELITAAQRDEVEEYLNRVANKSELERKEDKNKEGVFTGSFAKNPLNGERVPIWVADYVLPGYGTGAIMAVPAHDERDFKFAKVHNLGIQEVVVDGILVNSGKYSGKSSEEAKEEIVSLLKADEKAAPLTTYHLHDWSISRQRYWGTPIPMIHCLKCGVVPVPEKDLPIELPYDVDYTPKGKPPLASNEKWLKVKCPKCGGSAKRDAETMDTFVDSSWYFFRYISPKFASALVDPLLVDKIMPVDIYFGGAEHNLGHTLYSRFITKVLHDLGVTKYEEYAQKRVNHGIVLGPDGQKMSKSKGNVVNPDTEVKKYGTDAVRAYVLFFMPYEGTGPWVSERIWGTYRFLERVWNLADSISERQASEEDLVMLNRTIKKVTEDIEDIKFNTAVASLMEWLNYLSKKGEVSKEEFKTFLLMLAPIAPFITEELWERLQADAATGEEKLEDNSWSIHQQSWPIFDSNYLQGVQVTIVVQVNGKVRDQLLIEKDLLSKDEVIKNKALESEKVKKFVEGKEIKRAIYIEGKVINLVV